jgi:hypothetical protein
MKTLIPSAYSASVTNLKERAFGSAAPDQFGSEGMAISQRPRKGPMRTTPIPFRLDANIPVNILQANPHRKGLLIQNLDPVDNLYVSYGLVISVDNFTQLFFIGPLGYQLLDYVTPTDAVWLFATVDLSGNIQEFAPIAE